MPSTAVPLKLDRYVVLFKTGVNLESESIWATVEARTATEAAYVAQTVVLREHPYARFAGMSYAAEAA